MGGLPVEEEVEEGARAMVAHELVPEHVRGSEEETVGDVAHVDVQLAQEEVDHEEERLGRG